MGTMAAANGFADLWVGNHDPSASEDPDAGTLQVNNQYMNSITKDLFECMDPTFGAQVWLKRTYVPPARVFSSPTFSNVTTATILSNSRDTQVSYSFPASITTVVGTQTITATLQYADDAGMTTNVVTLPSDATSIGGVLSLAVTSRLQVNGVIPAGKYRKVTLAQTGGATVPTTISNAQEVLL